MRDRSQDALTATAFHEAGHVVAAWRQGLRINGATIVPNRDAAGHVMHDNPLRGIRLDIDGSDKARLRGEKAIIVCLAGPAAQRQFNPRSWRTYHGAGDYETALDGAMRLNGSVEATTAYMKWLEITTRNMIEQSWPLVTAVAETLLERRMLTANELKDEIKAVIVGRRDPSQRPPIICTKSETLGVRLKLPPISRPPDAS